MPGTLFVAQTPYHLILSLGLSKPGDTLQIIDDFQGSDVYAQIVRKHYPRLTVPEVLPGRATTGDSMKERVRHSRKNIKALRGQIDRSRYSGLVLFNDRTPETQFAAYLAKKEGLSVQMVEDGLAAYLPSKEDEPNVMRKILAKLLFGRYYRNIVILGTSPYVNSISVFYPDLVIPALQGKDVLTLDHALFESVSSDLVEELTRGISEDIDIIIALPHSEILCVGSSYASSESLQSDIQRVTKEAMAKYGKVAVKYHPREEKDYLGNYEGCEMLPKQTSLELIYLMLKDKKIQEIIGPLSTSLYTARIILGTDIKISVIDGSSAPQYIDLMESLGISIINFHIH